MKVRYLGMLLPLALLWSVACGPPGPPGEDGEQGDMTFKPPPEWSTWRDSSQLAEGGQVELGVVSRDDGQILRVLQASSSDPRVLEVVETGYDNIVVRGVADGEAMLQVVARRPDGSNVDDSLAIGVREVARHTLTHDCADSPNWLYLPSQYLRLTSQLYSDEDVKLVGYDVPPVRVDGLELDADHTRGTTVSLRTGDAGTQGTLESTVTDDKLEFEVVEFGQVDGVTAVADWGNEGDLKAGGSPAVYQVYPTVNDATVCNSGLRSRVESETTAICEVIPMGTQYEDGRRRGTSFAVEPLAEGLCEVDFALETADGEEQYATQISFEILPDDSE